MATSNDKNRQAVESVGISQSTMDEVTRDDTFPFRVYDMIEHCDAFDRDTACFHTGKGYGFIVKNEENLALRYLKQFKICKTKEKDDAPKFSSFLRQLNIYGFRKNKRFKAATYQHKDGFFCKNKKEKLNFISRNPNPCVSSERLVTFDPSCMPSQHYTNMKTEWAALEKRLEQRINDQSLRLERSLKGIQEDVNKLRNLILGGEEQHGGPVPKNVVGKCGAGCKRLRSDASSDEGLGLSRHSLPIERKKCATKSITTSDMSVQDEPDPALPPIGPGNKSDIMDVDEKSEQAGGNEESFASHRPDPASGVMNLADAEKMIDMADHDLETLASDLSYFFDAPNEENTSTEDATVLPKDAHHEQQHSSAKRRRHLDSLAGSPDSTLPSATVVSNTTKESSFSAVAHPRRNDVLCGEGDCFSNHTGNQTHSILVFSHKNGYAKSTAEGKREIGWSIVKAIRQSEGRFLKRVIREEQGGDGEQWYDVGNDAAIEMTVRALDKAILHGSHVSEFCDDDEIGGEDNDSSGSGHSRGGPGSKGDNNGSRTGGNRRTTDKAETKGRSTTGTDDTPTVQEEIQDAHHELARQRDALPEIEELHHMASDLEDELDCDNHRDQCKPKRDDEMNDSDNLSLGMESVSSKLTTACKESKGSWIAMPRSQDPAVLKMSFGAEARVDIECLISRMLRNDSTLTKIVLRKNEIDQDGAKTLATALHCNTMIKSIDLWSNKVGDNGIVALVSALCQNSTLKVLSLGQNNISNTGAKVIAEVIPVTTIVSLDLEDNNLGVGGAVSLATGLRDSATLKTLRLGGNQIEDEGAETIAGLIRVNQHIVALYLERNGISCKGAASIASALQQNSALRALDLGENQIGSEGVKVLARALCQNTSLSTMGLQGNKICNEGAEAFKRMLRKNRTITRLSLENCGINIELKDEIISSLKLKENSSRVKDDMIALFKRLQADSGDRNNIVVLMSAPLVWKDDKENLHQIQDSVNFELEKALLTKCVQDSKKEIALSFDVAAEGVLRAAATARCGCLHFSGHGYPGYLLFEDGTGGADWLEEDKIYEFVNEDSFGLVFVSGSNTICTGTAFMKAGVRHVICCEQNNALEDEAAVIFTDEFYGRLMRGFTIAMAFDKAKLAVLQRFDSVGANKFLLLPRDGDHHVRTFGSGVAESYTRKSMHNVVPTHPQYQGREIELYRLIQLVFLQRVVNAVGSDSHGCSTLATAAFKYMSERRSVLLDIDDVYYIPCGTVERIMITGKKSPENVLQHLLFGDHGGGKAASIDKDKAVRSAIDNLRGSKSLLILDDVSHEGALLLLGMVKFLLEGTGGVRLLLFSRVPLDLVPCGMEQRCKTFILRDRVATE